MEIKGLAAAAACHSRFLDGYSFLRRKVTEPQVAILIYHRVCPEEDDWFTPRLSPQTFEKEIEYFCRTYEFLPLEKLAQRVHQRKPLPEKAIVITLDDGNRDNYAYAYPILKKYHVPATIFLATGYIGTGRPFWWSKVDHAIRNTPLTELELKSLGTYSLRTAEDRRRAAFMIIDKLNEITEGQKNSLIEKLVSISGVNIPADLAKDRILSWSEVREMKDGGISFGAHSVTHPILTHVPLEQAKWEIIQSKKDIEEKVGQGVTAFAYPNGIFSAELSRIVRESGFTCAVTVNPGKLITSKADPYELNRIGAIEDFGKLKVLLSGLYYDLKAVLSTIDQKLQHSKEG